MFQESLKRLVNETEGGIAGLLMGFDGITVESYIGEGQSIDIQTVGMEFSFILTQVRKAAEILELGGVEEVSFRCAQLIVAVRILSADYFVALALKPEGSLGKGRYLMRVVAPQIQAEIA